MMRLIETAAMELADEAGGWEAEEDFDGDDIDPGDGIFCGGEGGPGGSDAGFFDAGDGGEGEGVGLLGKGAEDGPLDVQEARVGLTIAGPAADEIILGESAGGGGLEEVDFACAGEDGQLGEIGWEKAGFGGPGCGVEGLEAVGRPNQKIQIRAGIENGPETIKNECVWR